MKRFNDSSTMLSLFVIAILLVPATSGTGVWGETIVYPEDGFAALQNAVHAGGTVVLRAKTRDGVPTAVKVPNNSHLFLGYYGNPVTLLGEVVDGVQSTVWGDTFSQKNVVWIKSGGVTIRNLAIAAKWPRDGAIWMRGDGMDDGVHAGTGAPIVIEDNTIYSEQYGIGGQRTGGWPLVIRNNAITVVCPRNASGAYRNVESIGIKLYNAGYWVGSGGNKNDPTTWTAASTPVDVLDNEISVTNTVQNGYVTAGIRVEGWTVVGMGPEWGDNGEVCIVGNYVAVDGAFFKPAMAIVLGWTTAGLNHCLAQDNELEATCNMGLFRSFYGGDNEIVGNDLTEVVAVVPMEIGGHDQVISDNIFGPLEFSFGALLLESANVVPDYCPMPVPTANCTITNNDYRQTGAPGWVDQDSGIPANGCIMIDSEVDMGGFGTRVGTEVKNNLIQETGRFPVGTGGPKNQIYEFNLSTPALCYNNRIVGLPADHIMNPGVGQRLKAARQATDELLWDAVQSSEE